MTTLRQGKQAAPRGHTRKAYDGICKMLFHNEIVAGQKIAYRDLAERLNMSQTPVIQALKWLEFKQLVRHEPNRGYYTAPINLQEVEEIYDLRKLIELDLLKKSLRRMTAAKLEMLKVRLNAHRKASKDVYLYDRLIKDMEYHLALAGLAECTVHQQTLKNLFDLLYLKYGAKFLFSSSMNSADTDHQDLFRHIARGDHAGARRVLARHIDRVKKHVIQGVKKMISATQL